MGLQRRPAYPASYDKAFTSASTKSNTQAMMEGVHKNPAAANLVHIPGFLLLGGGVSDQEWQRNDRC